MKRLGYCKPIKAKYLKRILDLHLDNFLLEDILLTSIEKMAIKKATLDGTSKMA